MGSRRPAGTPGRGADSPVATRSQDQGTRRRTAAFPWPGRDKPNGTNGLATIRTPNPGRSVREDGPALVQLVPGQHGQRQARRLGRSRLMPANPTI